MWVVGLRRSLARSAEASTNLVCRRRVLPTVNMGQSFAVSRAFSATASDMQENDAAGSAAPAETKAQSEATDGIRRTKAQHPALVRAREKEKKANEVLQHKKAKVRIEVEKLKEEEEKVRQEAKKIEQTTKRAEEEAEGKVKKVQEQMQKIKKKKLTPAEKKAKRADLQEKIRAIRKAKAIEVKTHRRERHAKAVAKAQARRERAEQKMAKQMEKVAESKKERQDLAEELSSLRFPEKKPNNPYINFMSINIPPKEDSVSSTTYKQAFTDTTAKWHALTEEEQAKYAIDDYDAKFEDWKKKKAAWKASLTPRQRGLLKHPRTPGTFTPFTLFMKEHLVLGSKASTQMKGISEKWHALTDAEIEDYRIRAAELTNKARAAAAAAEKDAEA